MRGGLFNSYFPIFWIKVAAFRSSRPDDVFLRKGVLKICSIFTGEHSCRSAISMKFQSNFIEIALRHGCSPVYLLHISRTPFPRNTSGWLHLGFRFFYYFFLTASASAKVTCSDDLMN